jgi:glycosyltransferase involved in cell wall biosynthesis
VLDTSIKFSVVIPAYNEVRFLPDTLAALVRAMDALEMSGEVIVVDNNSDDGTAAVADECGTRVVYESINQISRARNTGATSAVGKYLIFLDADTLVSAPLMRHALAALDSGDVCGGGAGVVIEHQSRIANTTVAVWSMIGRVGKLAAGCFVYCRKDAFEAVGGFSEEVYASEEIWLSLALRKWGRSNQQTFLILDDAATTSARKLEWLSGFDIVKQTLVLLCFLFAVRSKRFCRTWYNRPNNDAN